MLRQVLWLSLFLLLSACSPPEAKDYKEAQSQIELGHYRIALSHIDRVIKRAPTGDFALKAARDGARISFYEIKEYKRAIDYYQFLVLHSKDPQERITAQKQLPAIYFDNLQNYEKAIFEYNKLIKSSETDSEIAQYKLSIARANYYLSNFFQAQSELEDVLKLKVEETVKFSAWILRSNIYIAQKDYAKAIDILKRLSQQFPEKAIQENVPQTLAVCYEETGNFAEAIRVLEDVKTRHAKPEYVEIRIKRLKERQKNQPGARGLRK